MPEPEIFVFDSTVMNDLQMCARKFEFAHVRNWRSLSGRATPLDRGSMIHEMLAVYRILLKLNWSGNNVAALTKMETELLKEHDIDGNVKRSWKEMVELSAFVGRTYMAVDSENLSTNDGEEIIRQFVEYTDYYQNDGWQPLEIESPFSKILYEVQGSNPDSRGQDRLAHGFTRREDRSRYKTASQRVEQSKLSNQFLVTPGQRELRLWLLIELDFKRLYRLLSVFREFLCSYPRSMKDEWREWAIYWARWAAFHVKEGIFPPNFTSCDKFGGCIYRSVCETDPQNREWKASTLFRVAGAVDSSRQGHNSRGSNSSRSGRIIYWQLYINVTTVRRTIRNLLSSKY